MDPWNLHMHPTLYCSHLNTHTDSVNTPDPKVFVALQLLKSVTITTHTPLTQDILGNYNIEREEQALEITHSYY